jgi:hypothetical protein
MSRIQLWLRRLLQRQFVWFLLLWLAGVAGTALLALPFHLLVVAAKS